MDVIFDTQKGESFTIEIGYFDTVLEIKEKVEKYREIPVSKQTLVFNGKILDNSGDVGSCVILHNSRIRLIVAAPLEEKLKLKQASNNEDQLLFHSLSPPITNLSKKTRIVLRLPSLKPSFANQKLVIDVDLNDSVEQLKKKLYQIEGFPEHRQALYLNRSFELQDHRHLRNYELKDGSEIDVLLRPTSAPKPPGVKNTMSTMSSKKLKVIVLTKCGTKRLILEVNPMEKVQMLRNELEKMQQDMDFQLPSEGYFFIYKQNVMEEKETFQWHNVRQHDTIEIFNGSITGGS